VPDAAKNIQLLISGPAELIAFGSAAPVAAGSFQSPSAQTRNGRALAILRAGGRAGRVKIEARSEGLRGGTATLLLT
jgi:beta-galactosidase